VYSDGIARSFSGAARRYELWNLPQRRIGAMLSELLPEQIPDGAILDVGCGTGVFTDTLRRRYPGREIVGIDIAPGMVEVCREQWRDTKGVAFHTDDAEVLAPGDYPCGLLASNCTFQWFRNLPETVARLAAQLHPGGIMAASTLLKGSLAELDEAYLDVTGVTRPGLPFVTADAYIAAIEAASLQPVDVREEQVVVMYDCAMDALRSFQGIGATFRHQAGYEPLSPGMVRALAKAYTRQFAGPAEQVGVTYQVLCWIARNRDAA